MKTAFEYFMVVAEEKSISRAAERLYLSSQNLSNYIKRLESEYGILFLRKPQFQLTPAGQALLTALRQISVLEKNLDSQIRQLKTGSYGYLRIGLHATTARMLLPSIIPAYRRLCPDIFLDFYYHPVVRLEELLLNGDIDLFFGVDTTRRAEFTYIPLQKEPIYFIASKELLKENGIDPFQTEIKKNELSAFSYLLSPPTSSFRKKIDSFCTLHGIQLTESVRLSDFELQLMLAAENQGACFCPKRLLGKMTELNRHQPDEKQLCAMSVESLNFFSDLALVTHQLAKHTPALETFIQVFRDEFPEHYYQKLGLDK